MGATGQQGAAVTEQAAGEDRAADDERALGLLASLAGDVAARYFKGEIGLDGLPVDGKEPAPAAEREAAGAG